MGACLDCLKCMACCSTKAGSVCCALFSLIGTVFLAVLGILMTIQWEYIHGIHDEHEAEYAATNSFIGAGIYAAIFCMCMVSFVIHSKKEQKTTSSKAATSDNNIELESLQQNGTLDFGLLAADSLAGNGSTRPLNSAQVSVQ
ncbi:Hypothetical Protein FCC1311_021012 [Hondaea fermentalgiana]|uniref:Uncharacterized protein n=1 Tax=Hondaea fermentalgiana TaxID=2315210 RepID=A0A2R5G4D7_9STRA|nr:Hypothetical Protein FCC1311_021012 [Hondaea fermentalgiana]|eukprot:GBG25882.1 Hypothetical Protein FCC1311_021012 [Hondaea fermentalgiana]